MRVVSPPAGVLGALILTALHPQPSRRGTVRCCALLDARAPQLNADPDVAFVLSGYEARALLKLKKGAPATGGVAIAGPHSIDLGASSAASLLITADGVALNEPAPGGEPENSPPAASVTWDELKKIEKRGGAYKCYWPHLGYSVDKVEGFSEETQRAASLLPVDGAHRNEPRYLRIQPLLHRATDSSTYGRRRARHRDAGRLRDAPLRERGRPWDGACGVDAV